jgi:hypothetical protein
MIQLLKEREAEEFEGIIVAYFKLLLLLLLLLQDGKRRTDI